MSPTQGILSLSLKASGSVAGSLAAALMISASLTPAEAREACVKYYKCVPLAQFRCQHIRRLTQDVHQICYSRQKRYLIIWLGPRNTPYHYCEIGPEIVAQLLNARSKDDYYEENIRVSSNEGKYDCRTHPIPQF
jgi:hypothetical protein